MVIPELEINDFIDDDRNKQLYVDAARVIHNLQLIIWKPEEISYCQVLEAKLPNKKKARNKLAFAQHLQVDLNI